MLNTSFEESDDILQKFEEAGLLRPQSGPFFCPLDKSQLSIMPPQDPVSPGKILLGFLRELYHCHCDMSQTLAFDVSQMLAVAENELTMNDGPMDEDQLIETYFAGQSIVSRSKIAKFVQQEYD